jgi:hypothetical protein
MQSRYRHERQLNEYKTDMLLLIARGVYGIGGVKNFDPQRYGDMWYQDKRKEPEIKLSMGEVLSGYAALHEKLRVAG